MKLLILILFLFGFGVRAQNDSIRAWSIDKYVHEMESSKKNRNAKSFKIKIDTLDFKVSVYDQKYKFNIQLKGSKTLLEIHCYLNQGYLVKAYAKEFRPENLEHIYRFFNLYYEDGIMFYHQERYIILPCIGIPKDKPLIEVFGYNKLIAVDLINDLVLKSIDKVKNHR